MSGQTESVAAVIENLTNVTVAIAFSKLAFQDALVAITDEPAHTMRLSFIIKGAHVKTRAVLSKDQLHSRCNI